jgi:hypothetical protein
MNRVDIVILCCLAIFILWYIHRQIRILSQQIEFDSPLREVIAAQVELQNEFLSEALKLSEQEISGATQIIRGITVQLQIWKAHYSGEVAFYRKFAEEPVKRTIIHEFPTSHYQFPLALAKHTLFAVADENFHLDFGPNSPEKLEVLLSHKAIIIRARDGRFEWDASGHCYKQQPSDLVIPIREQDLQECVDTYGQDDPDWSMMTGHERRYERRGRWARWSIFAVFPESLSRTTSSLDASVVKPNDGGPRL